MPRGKRVLISLMIRPKNMTRYKQRFRTPHSRYKTELPTLPELKTSYTFDDMGFTGFSTQIINPSRIKVKTSSNEMPSHQPTRRYIKKGYFTTDTGSSFQGPPRGTMRSPVCLPTTVLSVLLTVWSFARIPLITGGPARRENQASLTRS